MDKPLAWTVSVALAIIAAALTVTAYQSWRVATVPALTAQYHAVVLIGGTAYFGKIENLQADHLVLNDVFYIQSRQHPETKQVTNILVKRGQEWHAPDRMILNKRHVVLIEPVSEGSQVAKLIADQSGRTKPEPKDKK
jgi:hypothetical protein